MIISLALAFILSFYISSKISRPITDITKSARKLADGQYGTTFHAEGQYTEIQNLADTLNKTSYELEKASLLQKDLMANVSHDLRTPLTMIKSYAEMIRDLSGDNPEKREKHLQVIIEESDRLNVLVTDVLELSRMQAGTSQIRIASFNIRDTLDQLVNPYHEAVHITRLFPGNFCDDFITVIFPDRSVYYISFCAFNLLPGDSDRSSSCRLSCNIFRRSKYTCILRIS